MPGLLEGRYDPVVTVLGSLLRTVGQARPAGRLPRCYESLVVAPTCTERNEVTRWLGRSPRAGSQGRSGGRKAASS